MEATTSEVVAGARLAQDAGVALIKTEQASTELSNLVQGISEEAHTYSQQAARISELMDGIRNVSVKSSRGTEDTAESVAELAQRVMRLKASVADFKLPEEDLPAGSGSERPTTPVKEHALASTESASADAGKPAGSPTANAVDTGRSASTRNGAAEPNEKDRVEPDLPLGGAAREAALSQRKGA
jgi:twitching motility protein PilJ